MTGYSCFVHSFGLKPSYGCIATGRSERALPGDAGQAVGASGNAKSACRSPVKIGLNEVVGNSKPSETLVQVGTAQQEVPFGGNDLVFIAIGRGNIWPVGQSGHRFGADRCLYASSGHTKAHI